MPDEAKIYRLDRITHSTLSEFDPKKTIVAVAVSPIEAHGPHLPLGQDCFEAQALIEATAEKAAERWGDWNLVILPPLPIGCDTIPHLGSINYPAPLVRDIAYHALRPFAKKGFARLAYSSFHGGPRHFLALEDAANKLTKKYGVAAMSFFSVVAARMAQGNFFYEALKDSPENRMTLEQIEKDLHAGMTETSIGLHLWPELVGGEWNSIPDLVSGADENPHDEMLFGNKKAADLIQQVMRVKAGVTAALDTVKHYKKHNYMGYPASASAEQGRLLFDKLVDIAAEIIDEFMEKGRDMNVHSSVWPLKEAMLSPAVNTVLEEWFNFYSG